MSANSCGCDPEEDHTCADHQIEALKERISELEDRLAAVREFCTCEWPDLPQAPQ